MLKRILNYWAFYVSFFIIQNSFSQEIQHTRFANIDVLVILYKNTAGTKIPDEQIPGIKKGLELAREFYWRNSGCKLNLNLSYLEISEFKSLSFFPPDGLLWPQFVEQDFKNHGIKENQYGIIVLIYGPLEGGGNYGGMSLLGETGYSFFRYPFRTTVLYPGVDKSIEYKCTWLFTHELQHSVDLICYEKSGCSDLWHGDQPLDYSIQAGEQFSYQAEIFHHFQDYLKIKQPWGSVIQSGDIDGDRFPDNDLRVPMDEHRFGSDSTKVDSDLDGLSDLKEYMAGIYQSSDPNKKDTDGDGLDDGEDAYVLDYASPEIPKLTPELEGDLTNWYLLTDRIDFFYSDIANQKPLCAKIYLSWDDEYLYFASATDTPVELHLDLDMKNDGWWHGNDNYRLIVDPFADRFSEIRVMDTTEKARKLRLKLGNGYYELWDDDPEYIAQFGRLLDEYAVKLSTSSTESDFIIKIAIPQNDLIGFKLTENAQIGMRIYYHQISSPPEEYWATVFEQYTFFDITLK